MLLADRKEAHEFFTLWDVDPETHKIRLRTPSPPLSLALCLSATSTTGLYDVLSFQPWADRMREAREWLEERRSRVSDWFDD